MGDAVAVPRRSAPLLAVFGIAMCVTSSTPVHARVDGYFDIIGNARETETEADDGGSERTRSDGLIWRLNLNYRRLLTPNLSWRVAGWFEQERSSSELGDTTFELGRRRFRPLIAINLRTEMSYAELFWERRDESLEFDVSPDTKETQETYRFSLGWVPDETVWPSARAQYERRHRYDGTRSLQDVTEDTVQLISQYRPADALELLYRGSVTVFDNTVSSTEIERTTHNARVSYGDTFWNGRVAVSSDLNANYARSETVSSGTGEFFDPVIPFAGLSAIDEFPAIGPLQNNPALIDGDVTVGTGIDLGLPPVGGDDRPRNIGLDLASPTDVDVLRVWVDQELPLTVSSSFSWVVYISDDNEEWRFVSSVPVAPFDIFENRFEIRFPRVVTRFVKVVVEPLGPGDPDAQDFPSIQVTELLGGTIREGKDLVSRRSGDSEILNFSTRARLLREESFFYDFASFWTTSSDGPTQFTILNGLSYSRRLGTVYSTSARLAREDNNEVEGRFHAYLVSASLSAAPLDTLRHSVVVSARDEASDDRIATRDSATIAFTTAATLYDGIELSGTASQSRFRPDATRLVTVAEQYGAVLALTPHPTLTFNFGFTARTVDSPTIDPDSVGDPSRRSRRAAVSYRPVRNVYFFASRRIDRVAAAEERIQDDFSANWSPFTGGQLRLLFSYSESSRNLPDSEDRAIVSTLRWNVRRGTFIDLSYRRLRRDTAFDITRQNSYTGNLRVAF